MRQKVTLELNSEVHDLVRRVARDLDVSRASLVDALVIYGLQQYVDGGLDLADYLIPAESGRYRFQAEVEPDALKDAIARKANIT